MYFFTELSKSPVVFESCGIFISKGPWKHANRYIRSHELIICIEGILPLEVEGERFEIHPNEIFIIPPGKRHSGYRISEETISFVWIHFSYHDFVALNPQDIQPYLDRACDKSILCLPVYNKQLNTNRLHLMANQLIDIYQEYSPKEYLSAYMTCILHEISNQTLRYLQNSPISCDTIQPIQDWIRINAFSDISLQEIADYFNYNKNYLSRKYKALIGISISEQITKYRIGHAKFLLSTSQDTIHEISSAVGYEDPKYFMRTFKKVENMTPTDYRQAFTKKHFNND